MDAVLFLKEYGRMCDSNCNCVDCEFNKITDAAVLNCRRAMVDNPTCIVEIVENWSRENPVKTMMDDFFEKFPNAPKGVSGEPTCCPHSCGYCEKDCDSELSCVDCWSKPLEESK